MVLLSLRINHVSLVCHDLEESIRFYRDVLGFYEIKRPDSFHFDGSWLYGPHGIGIHLIEGNPLPKPSTISPLSNHMSFQSNNLNAVMTHLQSLNIKYIQQDVFEAGIQVVQIFFHDPDNNMVEVCNCDSLPICPLKNMNNNNSSSSSIDSENNISRRIDVRDSFESSNSHFC